MDKIPLIVVAGPTASGKTSLAVEIAKRYSGEVVSADSMQIYRYMDIGTAKPTRQEMEGVPHHMIDVVEPDAPFSVAQYAQLAHSVIKKIYAAGKLPILAGGTGLYIDHVVQNLTLSEMEIDYALRAKLEAEAKEKGTQYLHDALIKIDPEAAKKIHPSNVRRVIRALEVYYATGDTFTNQAKRSKLQQSPYDVLMLIPTWERETLYQRIDLRVDQMLKDGLLAEFYQLVDMGYGRRLNSMQAIGYKELFDYYYGLCSLPEAAELIKRHSRRYAKRQLTWFKRYTDAVRLDAAREMPSQCFMVLDNWIKSR